MHRAIFQGSSQLCRQSTHPPKSAKWTVTAFEELGVVELTHLCMPGAQTSNNAAHKPHAAQTATKAAATQYAPGAAAAAKPRSGLQKAAPPAQGSLQLQVLNGNPGAMCTRQGPETMLLLSHEYVEKVLLDGEDQAVPRIHK